MTDFFFTQQAAELQANHDKVSAVDGDIAGTKDTFQPPRNNQWNGYLDPEHQSGLPAPNGYPGNSGGGGVAYTANKEISLGIFAGAAGSTVSSDSDGWIFTNSIYRIYDYTTEQLDDIDVNAVPVYIKGQDGSEYFATNATNGVNVSKVGGQLKVEITDVIFAELGITKLWRWFDTERAGRVTELGVIESLRKVGEPIVLIPRGNYANGITLDWSSTGFEASNFRFIELTATTSNSASGGGGVDVLYIPSELFLSSTSRICVAESSRDGGITGFASAGAINTTSTSLLTSVVASGTTYAAQFNGVRGIA